MVFGGQITFFFRAQKMFFAAFFFRRSEKPPFFGAQNQKSSFSAGAEGAKAYRSAEVFFFNNRIWTAHKQYSRVGMLCLEGRNNQYSIISTI